MVLLKLDVGRRYTTLLVLSTLTAFFIGERVCGRRYYPAAAFMSASDASACFGRYSSWATRNSLFACRPRSRVMLVTMMSNEFNKRVITGRLEKNYKADLAALATKFGTMIESVDDIEDVHVAELDGDHMQLEVVYCDRAESTCVAVAVPIAFPRHCDDEDCIIDVIRDLEKMDGVDVASEVRLPKKKIPKELMETIARICVVMNRDFQNELESFVRAFGGKSSNRPTGVCEMSDLTPDGFVVRAAMFPEDPVTIAFPKECLSASDFQEQILALSERAISII